MTSAPPLTIPQPSMPSILSGIPQSAESYALFELLQGKMAKLSPRTIIHIAASDRALSTIATTIGFFAPHIEVLEFPAWDCLPYDRVSPQTAIMAKRMHALSQLCKPVDSKKRVVLTTANAILQKLPPKSLIAQVGLVLTRGDAIKQDALAQALVAQGYRRAGKAMESGEFALRGSIIDIVPWAQAKGCASTYSATILNRSSHSTP